MALLVLATETVKMILVYVWFPILVLRIIIFTEPEGGTNSKWGAYLKLGTNLSYGNLIMRAVINVQFQKISLPIPRRVTGNSKGEEVSKAEIVKRKYETKNWNLGGG